MRFSSSGNHCFGDFVFHLSRYGTRSKVPTLKFFSSRKQYFSGKVFKSVMDIKNIGNVDSREYKCVVKMSETDFSVESQPATFYRMGLYYFETCGYVHLISTLFRFRGGDKLIFHHL